MAKKSQSNFREWKDYLVEKLRDPEEAMAYLQVAIEEYQNDHHLDALLLALDNIAKAQPGGMTALARRTSMSRQNLYKALSEGGNPRLETFDQILHGLGYRMSIEPLDHHTGA